MRNLWHLVENKLNDEILICPDSLLSSPAVAEFAKAPWDVNDDGVIDILDLVVVGQHFGEVAEAPEE